MEQSKIKIKIDLRPVSWEENHPNARVCINGQEIFAGESLASATSVEAEITPAAVNKIVVYHWGKDPCNIPAGQDVALCVDNVWFDGIALHHPLMYSTSEFYPNWQWPGAPEVVYNNCYLGFNGAWVLPFPEKPVAWMMDVVEDEMFQTTPVAVEETSSEGPNEWEKFLQDFKI